MYNWGGNVVQSIQAARRLLICPYQADSGAENKIAISSLDTNGELPLATLQALFNVYEDVEAGNKWAATPQLSEFAPTEIDPTVSTSDWYTRDMDDGYRDISFFLNDNAPFVTKQLAYLKTGAYAFSPLTQDGYLLFRSDGTSLFPLRIQEGSFKATSWSLPGSTVHSKNAIKFRLNEVTSMNDVIPVKMATGSVTSDADFFSLTDMIVTATSPTTGGVTLAFEKRFRSNPKISIPVTGILYTEIFAKATDGTDDEAPGATENWTESTVTPGTYVWAETGVFTSGKTYNITVHHPRYDLYRTTANPGTFAIA